MFILIIWLQGIWLPEHGYSFSSTPLWAGIYMLPMTAGFLFAGPISGFLSDRFGARPFATGGMVLAAASFVLLGVLPVDFGYVWFALLLVMNGLAMGVFASPNQAGVMNSLPPESRGSGAGMVNTAQSAAQVLSIGIFFTLIIVGLASTLPDVLLHGLLRQGVPLADATRVSHLPPVGSLFAAFLGYDPMKTLLGPHVLAKLPAARAAYITGRSFFPKLISGPFSTGLREAFTFAAGACVVAAGASWMRGGKYVHGEHHDTERSSPTAGPEAASWSRGRRFVYGIADADSRLDDATERVSRTRVVTPTPTTATSTSRSGKPR
jgi:MFS family permease